MLSSRLKAFVSPTSQRNPTAQASTGLATNSTGDRAVEHEERRHELGPELRGGVEVDDVVEQPEAKTIAPPASTVTISSTIPTGPMTVARTTANAKPAKMPTPPKAGVGLVCHRSGRGSAPNATSARGHRSRPAIARNAIGAAVSTRSAFTGGEG